MNDVRCLRHPGRDLVLYAGDRRERFLWTESRRMGGGTFIVPLQNITPTGRDVICLTSEMPKLRKYDDECAANRASDACLIIVLRRKYPDTKPNR